MPPLLPEYLNQPVQVAIESPLSVDTDWWAIIGTFAGSIVGALIGGLVAYVATFRANRNLVNQAKLEECLTLVVELRSKYVPILNALRSMPSAHGIEPAKEIVRALKPKDLVDIAGKINTLSRLHARPVMGKTETLLFSAFEVASLKDSIDDRLGGGSPEIIRDWSGYAASLSKGIDKNCNELESYLLNKAKT